MLYWHLFSFYLICFSCWESHSQYHITFSCQVSIGTSAVTVSLLSLFLMILIDLKGTGYFLGCLLLRLVWCFSHHLTWVMVFWKEGHSGWVPFLSFYQAYIILRWLTVDININHLVEVITWLRQCLPALQASFSLFHTVLLGRKSWYMAYT